MRQPYLHIEPDKIKVKKDGTGEVTVFFQSERLLFALFELNPGCGLRRDIHETGDEGYWVCEGELTVELPGEEATVKVKKGEVFYIGRNTWHIARNEGDKKVSVIAAIGQPENIPTPHNANHPV